ncbi:hypothetical protein JVU11DRAFT_6807 [Chiua virens]|nr:hypothetical protein JVU11DRAFT_6807 [Chiua virens]
MANWVSRKYHSSRSASTVCNIPLDVSWHALGCFAHTSPNYQAAQNLYVIQPGPVQAMVIKQQQFQSQLNGIVQIVVAYDAS